MRVSCKVIHKDKDSDQPVGSSLMYRDKTPGSGSNLLINSPLDWLFGNVLPHEIGHYLGLLLDFFRLKVTQDLVTLGTLEFIK